MDNNKVYFITKHWSSLGILKLRGYIDTETNEFCDIRDGGRTKYPIGSEAFEKEEFARLRVEELKRVAIRTAQKQLQILKSKDPKTIPVKDEY